MADTKLSGLVALAGTGTAAGDLFYIDDVSATTAGSKSVRADGMLTAVTNATVLPSGAVVANTLKVQQPAGTPGTTEIQIYSDATASYLIDKHAAYKLNFATDGIGIRIESGGATMYVYGTGPTPYAGMTNVFGASGSAIGLGVGNTLCWSSNTSAFSANDTGLARSAAATVKITDGSTGLGSLVAGPVVVQQPGGTPGTDQVNISHDGTLGTIECKDGALKLDTPDDLAVFTPFNTPLFVQTGSDGFNNVSVAIAYTSGGSQPGVRLRSVGGFEWTASSGEARQAADTALIRSAAATVKITDGSSGIGSLLAGTVTTQEAAATGAPAASVTVTRPAHTALTASTEYSDVVVTAATQQFATGALTTQRAVKVLAPTYGFVGASTITTAANLFVAKPIAGTNATITNNFAIDAEDSRITGVLTVLESGGTVGTNDAQLYYSGGFTFLVSHYTESSGVKIGDSGIQMLWTGVRGIAVGGIQTAKNGQFAFSPTDYSGSGAATTGIVRVADKVVGYTDGQGNATGWSQNTGGVSRVNTASPPTNATNTMAAITGLSSTLIAGRKYAGRLTLFVSTDQAAEGAKFDFDGGAGTMTAFNAAVTSNVQGATLGTTVSAAIATDLTATALNGTGVNCIVITFDLVCNAAGTFIPRFSQVAHSSGTLTVVAADLQLEDIP